MFLYEQSEQAELPNKGGSACLSLFPVRSKHLIHETLAIPGPIRSFAQKFKVTTESQHAFSNVLLSFSKLRKTLPLGF